VAIRDFTIIMLVGIVVGTYSSIFVASPIVLMFGERARAGVLKEQAAAAEA
jgi:preprotein translocase subunit SecF